MGGRSLARVVVILFAVLAATSIGGLIGTVVLGATGEKYGSYGEVEIPGSALIDLPAGQVIVSFRAGEHRGRRSPEGTP